MGEIRKQLAASYAPDDFKGAENKIAGKPSRLGGVTSKMKELSDRAAMLENTLFGILSSLIGDSEISADPDFADCNGLLDEIESAAGGLESRLLRIKGLADELEQLLGGQS